MRRGKPTPMIVYVQAPPPSLWQRLWRSSTVRFFAVIVALLAIATVLHH